MWMHYMMRSSTLTHVYCTCTHAVHASFVHSASVQLSVEFGSSSYLYTSTQQTPLPTSSSVWSSREMRWTRDISSSWWGNTMLMPFALLFICAYMRFYHTFPFLCIPDTAHRLYIIRAHSSVHCVSSTPPLLRSPIPSLHLSVAQGWKECIKGPPFLV